MWDGVRCVGGGVPPPPPRGRRQGNAGSDDMNPVLCMVGGVVRGSNESLALK